MSSVGLEQVLAWFRKLSTIPRTSGDEKQISDTLKAYAEDKGREVVQDDAWNLIVRKPAHSGEEGRPGLVLQAHLDMVGEKTSGSEHDFTSDPIKIVRDGDLLHADETALGADDGVGVAICLALLDADDVAHPALELLFTTQEETGMNGAKALSSGQLRGRYFLNIDGEREGVFLCSGAGGSTLDVVFPFGEASPCEPVWELYLRDLHGGHSGLDIDKGRANGIAAVAGLLAGVPGVRFAALDAPGKFNAINREVRVTFAAAADVAATYDVWRQALAVVEPDATVSLTRLGATPCQTAEWTSRLLDFLGKVPPGVRAMSPSLPGVVETSFNLGLAQQNDQALTVTASVRSATSAHHQTLEKQVHEAAAEAGARVQVSGTYPAWEYQPDNPLRDQVAQFYTDLFGKPPVITGVHGGLECGVLYEKYPDLPMLSVGATISDAHTPRESVAISSINNLLKLVLVTVEGVE